MWRILLCLLVTFDIMDVFHEDRGERHGDQSAEHAGELGADDEGEDDHDRGDAYDLLDHERIEELALELIDDDVEADQKETGADAIIGKGDEDGRHRRYDRPEDRYDLEDGGQEGKYERVRDADDHEDEVDEHSDDHTEEDLSLEPVADLALGALPQVEYVNRMPGGSDDAKEIGHAFLLNGEIEREYDDQDEAEHAAKDKAGGLESACAGSGKSRLEPVDEIGDRDGMGREALRQ